MEKQLESMIGAFVKHNGNYGMIDAVYGERLGFIWSDKDSWTGCIVDTDKIEPLSSEEELAKARLSAKNYLLRERAHLLRRIKMNLEIDDQQRLRELLDFVSGWIVKMGI